MRKAARQRLNLAEMVYAKPVMTRLRGPAMTVGIYTVATLVMTFPLIQHPSRTLPSDLIDTLLNTWIIGWDADRLRHGLSGVWDAPIFFPYRNALAFSENLFGIAIFVAPIYWVTDNAVLTYNVAFIASFAFAGIGMFLLAHSLTGSRPAALVAGAYYAFCPYRMLQIMHIQMLATGWMPIGLLGLHRYFQTDRRRWLALFVVAYVLQVTSNMYVAYFMAIPAAFLIADGIVASRARWRTKVLEIVAAGTVVLVMLLPVLVPYYQARAAYRNVRNSVEIEMNSADLRSYFTPHEAVGIWRWLPTAAAVEGEKALFPGLLFVALGCVAALQASRLSSHDRRNVILYGAIAAVAAAVSFGPHVYGWGVKLTDHGPYDWLWRLVPGWDGMRVPARFGSVSLLALAVIGAIGGAILLRPVGRRGQTVATVCGFLIVLAEGWIVPMRVVAYNARGRPEDRDVTQWLAARPAGGVLDLPMVTDNFEELHYQYGTLRHGHPLVNGMSGYNSGLQRLFRNPAGPLYDWERPDAVVRMLRAVGIRYVVVHHGDYTREERRTREEEKSVELLRNSGQVVGERQLYGARVFELESRSETSSEPVGSPIDARLVTITVNQNEERARFLTDGDRDTRWFAEQDGETAIDVSFSQPTNVAFVELTTAERSITDYPRELRIDVADQNGVTRTLYSAPPYPELIKAFIRDGFYPRMNFALPENRAARLRIQQTASLPNRRWWSIHELRLWKR
jgi:Bacterial membrane protein YfhO